MSDINQNNLNETDCSVVNVDEDVISLSSSEGDDVIFINEVPAKKRRRIKMNVNEIFEELSSNNFDLNEPDFMDDINLNINSEESDGNISDVNTNIKVKWNKVQSPQGWTRSMKKYYNKPSKSQRYFDWKKILLLIRKGPLRQWEIKDKDIFPTFKKTKRCQNCRQTDHLYKNCPRKYGTCSMCGMPGHLHYRCPQRMCLNCGLELNNFTDCCRNCWDTINIKCKNCNRYGHETKNCPDLWRRFHNTIDHKEIKSIPSKLNENIQCCNCAKEGHLYEECTEEYWSSYTPTSCIVTNYKDIPLSNKSDESTSFLNKTFPQTSRSQKRQYHPNDYKNNTFNNDQSSPALKKKRMNSNSGQQKITSSRRSLPNNFFCIQNIFESKKKLKKKKKNKKKKSINRGISTSD